MTKAKAAKPSKKSLRKLHKIKCPNCLMEFTVANPDSYVCPNCYARKVTGLPDKPAEYIEKPKTKSKRKVNKEVR